MEARGFLEVETPLLYASAGGALARPFVTTSWAWDTELSLRIAPELFLKVSKGCNVICRALHCGCEWWQHVDGRGGGNHVPRVVAAAGCRWPGPCV